MRVANAETACVRATLAVMAFGFDALEPDDGGFGFPGGAKRGGRDVERHSVR